MGNLGFRIGIEGLGEASLSARSFYAPALTSSRSGQCLAEAAKFRFAGVGLLYGPESLRAQDGSLVEGRCAGADEGGDAGGSAKRRAAGRPHRAPLRRRVGRGLRLKSTGVL